MSILFNEISNGGFTDIQLLRTATIYDSRYGAVEITKAMLDKMVINFDEKVRGIEIMLDAGHNSDKEAYGWFKSLEVRLADGNQYELWAKVELTPIGQRALTEKLYGYISADFEIEYKDNETLTNYGVVLLGAALTNRPVIKRMKSAIELSENKKMDLPELLQAMGVASPEELVSMVSEMRAKMSSNESMYSEAQVVMAEQKRVADEAIKLAEESKKESDFTIMMSEGKAVPAQKDAFMKGDFNEFAKNAQPVKLATVTNGNANEVKEESAQSKIMKLAEGKMTEKKIGLTAAISLVLSENPELNAEYKTEMKGA